MCGIAGKVYFNEKKVNAKDVKKMTDKLIHRGPNDEGVYISNNERVGLGARRLSIIDLSKRGHQPMSYLNRYWIVTNGEFYNFKEERIKLRKLGYKFRSNSDTEVILALYDKYQERCLQYLRGMFAFCIYDAKKNTIFIARDRMGVKPLKYYLTNNVIIFASEAKAILTQSEVVKKPDFKSLAMYLAYGYIPSPYTGFLDIKKLEPGHYMFINLNTKKIVEKKYLEPIFKEKLQLSEAEWSTKILEELKESTRLRMISDVPLGAYLSGGVDSSGVVALMSKLSSKPVKTFTIAFEDKRWNEASYARNIAGLYHTDHVELTAKPTSAELLPEISYYYEEPFADAGAVVNYMVNDLAKKYVTVVLNGDGGDENFAGYPNRYMRLKRDVDYNKWISTIRPATLSLLNVAQKLTSNNLFGRSTKFLEKSRLPLYQKFQSYNQVFALEEIANLTTGEMSTYDYSEKIYEPVLKTFDNFKGKDLKDAGLKFDLQYWLPDDLLVKSDLMSMANSIETRSPFLDYKLTELASKIPFNLKVKNGESKYILKKALESVVPKENLYRKKMGFGMPLNLWFSGRLNSYTKKTLLNKKSQTRNLLNKGVIENMLATHNEANDLGPKLWTLLTLEIWFDTYFG